MRTPSRCHQDPKQRPVRAPGLPPCRQGAPGGLAGSPDTLVLGSQVELCAQLSQLRLCHNESQGTSEGCWCLEDSAECRPQSLGFLGPLVSYRGSTCTSSPSFPEVRASGQGRT